jgi:hypothetical protein
MTGACPLGTVAELAALQNIAGFHEYSSIQKAWRFQGNVLRQNMPAHAGSELQRAIWLFSSGLFGGR